MHPSIGSLLAGTKNVIPEFDTFVQSLGLEDVLRADHIGYVCGSSDEFEALRGLFKTERVWIYESTISGRTIAVIKMTRSVRTALGEITVLELSNQKPGGIDVSGWDHIEAFPTQGTMNDVARRLYDAGVNVERAVRSPTTTYDVVVGDRFKLRLEEEPLLKKIQREEMR